MRISDWSSDVCSSDLGFPRESTLSIDIGGVRTNFRMPDILAIGLGGGTRIHLDPARYESADIEDRELRVGPDSVGFHIGREACPFGGRTLTASDTAVAAGRAAFGDPARIPALSPPVKRALRPRMQAMLADGIDRMKTSQGAVIGRGHV